ncbi:MAG: DUF3341 domain-containing protein [Geminicoccaceae bacterium]|nr:DUF3341 domain-containing protein [Geminicoccaceae bacterium]
MTLLAEFAAADDLLDAIKRARGAGYSRLDALAPFAVSGLAEALGIRPSRLRVVMFACGAIGAAAGFFLQVWMNAIDYPLNTGGRPLVAWQAFMLVTFEFAVLGAAVGGFVALLWRTGLPRLHDPLFAVSGIERASQDRFFLVVDGGDPKFEPEGTRAFLEALRPIAVRETST